MKTITKFFTAVCAFGAFALCAEVINLSDVSNWNFFQTKPGFKDGKYIVSRGSGFRSKKLFTMDPNKTYTLSMDINRIKEDAKNPTILSVLKRLMPTEKFCLFTLISTMQTL